MFSLFPIIYTFYISLLNWTGITKPEFLGLLGLFERIISAIGVKAWKTTLWK